MSSKSIAPNLIAPALPFIGLGWYGTTFDWAVVVPDGDATVYTYSPWAAVGMLLLVTAYCVTDSLFCRRVLNKSKLGSLRGLIAVPIVALVIGFLLDDEVRVDRDGFVFQANTVADRRGNTDGKIYFDKLSHIELVTRSTRAGRGRGGTLWSLGGTAYEVRFRYPMTIENMRENREKNRRPNLRVRGDVKRRAMHQILQIAEKRGVEIGWPLREDIKNWATPPEPWQHSRKEPQADTVKAS